MCIRDSPRTGAAVPSVDPAGGDTRSAGGAAAAGSGGGAGTTVPSVSEPVRPGVAASDTPAGTSSPKTAGGAATVPDPATAETPAVTKPAAPAAVATSDPPPPPVVVISVDGTRQRAYPTLNAALVDAVDGSQVVLQYNGVRIESPMRVARKNITIRGAEGFRPGIEFRPKGTGGDGVQTRMITVTAGPLQVINVELRMVVPRGEQASLVMFLSLIHI